MLSLLADGIGKGILGNKIILKRICSLLFGSRPKKNMFLMSITQLSQVKTDTHAIKKNLMFTPEVLLVFHKAHFFIINSIGHHLYATNTADRQYLVFVFI